ncbi:MAG: hypothetical protein U1F58_14975 [Burkholderiales bacterium]
MAVDARVGSRTQNGVTPSGSPRTMAPTRRCVALPAGIRAASTRGRPAVAVRAAEAAGVEPVFAVRAIPIDVACGPQASAATLDARPDARDAMRAHGVLAREKAAGAKRLAHLRRPACRAGAHALRSRMRDRMRAARRAASARMPHTRRKSLAHLRIHVDARRPIGRRAP